MTESDQSADFRDWLSEVVVTPEFEHNVALILHKKHRWRWRMLTIWILGFTIFSLYLFIENGYRVNDIQKGRVASCQKTYESIRDVFKPFFAPPNNRTQEQTDQIRKFNNTIDARKAGCAIQTHVKTPKKKG